MADTPKEYIEGTVSKNLKEHPEKIAGIKAVYEFNITGDKGGTWTLDLTQTPAAVQSGSSGKASCTITMGSGDFMDMVSGKLNPQMAFMGGKLKVAGNMGLALKLQNILS